MSSCWIVPNKGAETFKKLNRAFGRKVAVDMYLKITGPDFMRIFGDQVETDKDNIPTFESLMELSDVREYIGKNKVLESYQKRQPVLENTLSNVSLLVNKAIEFNKNHKGVIAIVDYVEDNKLTLSIQSKTEETTQQADTQKRIQKLNEKVSELLSSAGITIDALSAEETAVGRVGVTEFRRAKNIANGFAVLMAVANNMEGNTAVSEEFAHFVLGVYRDKPLVARGINYCKNETHARAILGDEYDKVSEYYSGDIDAIAEEAAGHIFRQALIDKIDNTDKVKEPLFKRLLNYILNFFKGLNSTYYQNNIDAITRDYGKLAEQVIEGKRTITTEDIQKAKRIATFNALSEKVKTQIQTLKTLEEAAYKNATLQENLEEIKKGVLSRKTEARKFADKIHDAIVRYGPDESMAAITEVLSLAQQNLDRVYEDITHLEGKSAKDKFTILRGALTTIQAFTTQLNELEAITADEYFEDEDIANQSFMIEDNQNNLKEYEADDTVDTIETKDKSVKEVANIIQQNSKEWKLAEDESCYIDSNNNKALRTTTTIAADIDGETFDPTSPFVTPSTNIGTGMDEFTRDFLSGKMTEMSDGTFTINGKSLAEVYPNATITALNKYAKQLQKLKEGFDKKGITLITRDITINGTIDSIDGTGRVHTIRVAGTLDLLGYDKEGNWYIYDMKTHRGIINKKKEQKWQRQLTLYKKFLEDKYGVKVKEMGVIPIRVEYPTPLGYGNGSTQYSVEESKAPLEYGGTKNNQLIADGELFKGANPELEEILSVKPKTLNLQYSKLASDPTNGIGGSKQLIVDAVHQTRALYGKLTREFSQVAVPEFLNFLKPFVGENIKITDPNNKGKLMTVSIREVLENKTGDVTIMQRWFSSMADNPDALLQIFDKVVKIQKDAARLRTIEKSQEIIALGKKYEKLGITNYDFMYESDKKNYINKEFDKSEYERAKALKLEELNKQYGEHPTVGSEEYKNKREALRNWIKDNSVAKKDDRGSIVYIPNPTKFPSKYSKLNQLEKDFYDEWMTIKSELDSLIGPDKTHLTNTIKIRKTGIERLKGSLSGEAITNFVESTKAALKRSFDDDVTYKDRQGIRGFDGREVMKLPLYYVYGGKEDMSDLSTDAIGTLVAYADMAFNYEAMNQVVNPLEIGKEIAKSRKIKATRGGHQLKEIFQYRGGSKTNDIYLNTEASNFMALLNDFFESKIYGRYLVDNGDVKGINVNKATGALLKLGSMVQLGFNILANLSNLSTGVAMQNIEAAAGEYFNARELFKADKEFTKAMGSFVGDIGQRVLKSKLALFDQMFDVRQNFSTKIKHNSFLNKWLITRIFGPGIQYIGQDCGDHWLYNRTAIAMALKHKMLYTDNSGRTEEISLWDALETVPIDTNNPDSGNKLVLREGVTNLDGTKFDARSVSNLSGKIRQANQHMFGIYNQEDAIAARRMVWGRFLMQYRDWIPAQFRHRFGIKADNLEKGGSVEGFYRTTGRFIVECYQELKNGEKTISQVWDSLEMEDKRNVRRAIGEITQFIGLCILLAFLKGGADDKDRPWAVRVLHYWATRAKTELGVLTPTPAMFNEGLKIVKSPAAATNVIDDISGLTECLYPPNYFTEIESGDYKGHSKAYRAFMKSPFTLWYKTLKRTMSPEKAEKYFNQ